MLIPVILCGGAGSRLWPVSRELHPKPFMRLPDGQSLLQKAFLRGVGQSDVNEVLVVTNRDLYFKVDDELRTIGKNRVDATYLLEPFARNTAAAVAAAALNVQWRYGDEAQLLVLAADHLIHDLTAFAQAVHDAKRLAAAGKLVTFGIRPTRPETGYGYIEAEGTSVLRFVEKPDVETAKQYCTSARFHWNSGMFCFKAGTVLSEMARLCPDVLTPVRESLLHARRVEGDGVKQLVLGAEHFDKLPDISFDYAVMEKTTAAAMVACDIGWSDVGSWEAVSELVDADQRGNRVQGEALLHESDDCYVHGTDRLIAAVGIRDLIIVDTPDALLVVDKQRSQEVRQVFSQLKAASHEVHRSHRTVHRQWGTYTVLEEGHRFKLKRIVVRPGASLSLQMHHHRSEHWIVVSGEASITNSEETFLLHADQSTYIPVGHKHRLMNPGSVDLIMIEVQTGDYLGEDDIVRFDDTYGHA